MVSDWDRRQLVQARGSLERAHRHVQLAIQRLDERNETKFRAALAAVAWIEHLDVEDDTRAA